MIKVEAALSDLEKLETAKDTSGNDVSDVVKILRGFKVLVKFLSTMRSNQLLTDDDKTRIKKEKESRPPQSTAK